MNILRATGGSILLVCTSISLCACGIPSSEKPLLPCVVGVQEGGISLRTDSAISWSQAGGRIVRDSKGNFFGSASLGGQVLKWGQDGTLLAAIGRPGDGPGELGRGGVSVFVVADSLYVRDFHRHWVVFDPELRFTRTAEIGPIVAFARYDTHFIPGDLIVSTNQSAELPDDGIAILSREGRVVRSFAPEEMVGERWQPHPRASAYVGKGQLWVAPVAGPRDGYHIEIWDTAGILVDSIVRDVPWFQAQPDYGTGEVEAHGSMPFPYPSMSLVFADSVGMVWIVSAAARTPDAEARLRKASLEDRIRVRREVLEYHFDVYDAASHRLLASDVVSFPDGRFSDPIFSGRLVTLVREDSLGNEVTVVTSLSLHDQAGGNCSARSMR